MDYTSNTSQFIMNQNNTSVSSSIGLSYNSSHLPAPAFPIPDMEVLTSLQNILHSLKTYFVPPMICIGLLGNSVTIIGLLYCPVKSVPGSLFLAAKSVTDLLFLCAYTFLWLSEFGVSLYHSAGWCQFLTFINNATTFLSIWYTVCIMVERFISLYLSHASHKVCTTLKIKITIISLSLIALPVYLNISLTTAVQEVHTIYICMPLPMFYNALGVLNKIDAFLNVMLPFTVKILLVIMILAKLKPYCVGSCKSISKYYCYKSSNDTRCQNGTHSLTSEREDIDIGYNIVVCMVCILHLLLSLPSNGFRLKMLLTAMVYDTSRMTQKMYLIQTILMYPFYASFSVNIFAIVWWTSFRKNILYMVTNIKKFLAKKKSHTRDMISIEEGEALNM